MTTKSPTDLAQDARTLADSLRERFNAGEFTLHRAATMLDTLAAAARPVRPDRALQRERLLVRSRRCARMAWRGRERTSALRPRGRGCRLDLRCARDRRRDHRRLRGHRLVLH